MQDWSPESERAWVRQVMVEERGEVPTSVERVIDQLEAMIAWRIYRPDVGSSEVGEHRFNALVDAVLMLRLASSENALFPQFQPGDKETHIERSAMGVWAKLKQLIREEGNG